MSVRPIYLDGHSTTRVDPKVLEAMLPYFTERFGNPASLNHVYGWEAEAAVKQSREIIATAINASPEEIIFTSGATEANNLAIKGVAEAYFSQGRHLITVATEHRAVLDPCKYLESLGFEVTILPVQGNGLLDLKELEKAIRPDTILVSVMAANNEIGVLQPLEAIGKICKEHEVLFHTDAAQAIAKIPLDVEAMHIDLMSLTAHKIYGPKGVGALYRRRRQPRVNLVTQMQGGGQENNFRSGTLATPLLVGFAKAISLALAEMTLENQRQLELRNYFWEKLQDLPDIYLNGDLETRLAGNLNFSVGGLDGSALLLGLQSRLAVSSGSACSGAGTKPSHVITALGREPELAYATIRIGIGRFNTKAEIQAAAEYTKMTIQSLRQLQPPALIF